MRKPVFRICLLAVLLVLPFSGRTESEDFSGPMILDCIDELYDAEKTVPEVPCNPLLLTVSPGSGYIQLGSHLFCIGGQAAPPTLRELCSALDTSPMTQRNEPLSLELIGGPHDTDSYCRMYYGGKTGTYSDDTGYLVVCTEGIDGKTPLGDLRVVSINTDHVGLDAYIWFPGGISNKGLLHNGLRCYEPYLSSYAMFIKNCLYQANDFFVYGGYSSYELLQFHLLDAQYYFITDPDGVVEEFLRLF